MRSTFVDLASQPIRNLVKFYPFTGVQSGYSAAGAAGTTSIVTTGGPTGGAFVRRTFTGAGGNGLYVGTSLATRPTVTPGTYMASGYVRPSKDVTLRMTVEKKDTDGAMVETTTYGSGRVIPGGVWTRLSLVAPITTATGVTITFYNLLSEWVAGDTLDLADPMFHAGSDLLPFANGDTPGWRWTDVAGRSESVGYPYTLGSIAGSPLVTLGPDATSGALDPASFDPVARGVMLVSVLDVLAIPPGTRNVPFMLYGTVDDVPDNSQLTARFVNAGGAGTATLQTRRTGGGSPATLPVTSTPGRFVVANGIVPGGKSFSAYNGTINVDTSVTVAAVTHSSYRWYPASTWHAPVAGLILPGYNPQTLWRAVAWLARQYGAPIPTGY